jgi:hypothetical protein
MLWKQLNPRYRKLLRSGQQGEAVVVQAKEDRGGGSNVGPGIYGWDVTIRVKLPNGETADHERYVEATTLPDAMIGPGTKLPIRFDPSNPSRVEIDTGALRAYEASLTSAKQALDDERVREAESEIQPLGSDAPPSS